MKLIKMSYISKLLSGLIAACGVVTLGLQSAKINYSGTNVAEPIRLLKGPTSSHLNAKDTDSSDTEQDKLHRLQTVFSTLAELVIDRLNECEESDISHTKGQFQLTMTQALEIQAGSLTLDHYLALFLSCASIQKRQIVSSTSKFMLDAKYVLQNMLEKECSVNQVTFLQTISPPSTTQRMRGVVTTPEIYEEAMIETRQAIIGTKIQHQPLSTNLLTSKGHVCIVDYAGVVDFAHKDDPTAYVNRDFKFIDHARQLKQALIRIVDETILSLLPEYISDDDRSLLRQELLAALLLCEAESTKAFPLDAVNCVDMVAKHNLSGLFHLLCNLKNLNTNTEWFNHLKKCRDQVVSPHTPVGDLTRYVSIVGCCLYHHTLTLRADLNDALHQLTKQSVFHPHSTTPTKAGQLFWAAANIADAHYNTISQIMRALSTYSADDIRFSLTKGTLKIKKKVIGVYGFTNKQYSFIVETGHRINPGKKSNNSTLVEPNYVPQFMI